MEEHKHKEDYRSPSYFSFASWALVVDVAYVIGMLLGRWPFSWTLPLLPLIICGSATVFAYGVGLSILSDARKFKQFIDSDWPEPVYVDGSLNPAFLRQEIRVRRKLTQLTVSLSRERWQELADLCDDWDLRVPTSPENAAAIAEVSL